MDIIFVCNKCEHHLFIKVSDELINILKKIPNYDCPSCGINRELNWRYLGIGNGEEEKDNFNWMNKR